MRTVILIAGILINDGLNSIAITNGKQDTDNTAVVLFLIITFVVVIAMDIIDFISKE
jgi:hypothetical protein